MELWQVLFTDDDGKTLSWLNASKKDIIQAIENPDLIDKDKLIEI